MSGWNSYGARLFVNAFNERGDLVVSARLAVKQWRPGGSGDIFAGWMSQAVCSLVGLRKKMRLCFDGPSAWMNADGADILLRLNGALAGGRLDAVSRDASAIITALTWMRDKSGFEMSVSMSEAEGPDRVRRVEVVAMPERKIETTVMRDANGDITGSRTTEKDAA